MIKINERLAAKLAGIVVHLDEALGPDGRELDLVQAKMSLCDKDVQNFITNIGALAPKPRVATFSSTQEAPEPGAGASEEIKPGRRRRGQR